jgi:hypothetical protein
MERKLDIAKVNDALKRAARAAISGSREERAGRITSRDARTEGVKPDKKRLPGSAAAERGKK